ncbi:MAG TPA: cytochrome c [Anaeromyxobacteraceae bacterium]|nr:cytochrome c [Anaeromyxobacteraceae bacterium]
MKRIVAALFALTVTTAAMASPADTYAAKCKMCHGDRGQGGKMSAKPIAGLPSDQVKAAIENGKGKMKPVHIEDSAGVAQHVAGLPRPK